MLESECLQKVDEHKDEGGKTWDRFFFKRIKNCAAFLLLHRGNFQASHPLNRYVLRKKNTGQEALCAHLDVQGAHSQEPEFCALRKDKMEGTPRSEGKCPAFASGSHLEFYLKGSGLGH